MAVDVDKIGKHDLADAIGIVHSYSSLLKVYYLIDL